ncbi:MAG TPA: RHS repeat-associated core domain-containing protein, partial [Pirellulales bacterium]
DNYSDYGFAYNGQGDQTSVDNAGTPGAPHVVLTNQFDALGNRTSLAATLNGTADFINNYSYDTLSRLRDIAQQGQTGGNAVAPKSIYIGLNGAGDITALNYANTVSAGPQQTSPGYVTLTYSPTTGLLTGMNDTANGASIDNLAYTYDALGRVSTFTSIDGTATYGYDNTSQLVSAAYTTATGGHQPVNVSFTWDANGNNAAPGNVVSPNNEVTNDGTYTYTFDADGNRTSRTNISSAYATDYKTTYTWDYRNRLTDVEFFDNNNVLTKHVHYVYDVYDNLLEEDLDPNGGGTYTTKDQFVLDVQAKTPAAGNAPLERFDVSGNVVPLLPDDVLMELVNNQLTERFLNGPSRSGAADVIYAEGAVASLTQPDSVDWIFANNQGSPTDVVNSSGTLIDHEVYSPFGQVAYASNPGVFLLQGFSGGYSDPNTGLIKFGERWYDPLTTVWISVDPAALNAGGLNLTRYVRNDPSNASDPSGLLGLPTDQDSSSKSVWAALRNGQWQTARDLIDDIARHLNPSDKCILQGLRSAIKQIQSLDKWRKQMQGFSRKQKLEQIKSLEKTLEKHLKVRDACDTPETYRMRYQIDFLKRLTGAE